MPSTVYFLFLTLVLNHVYPGYLWTQQCTKRCNEVHIQENVNIQDKNPKNIVQSITYKQKKGKVRTGSI